MTLPGGRIIIWVPGLCSCTATSTRKVGHVQRYTPKTLRATVDKAGLEVEVLEPINFLGGRLVGGGPPGGVGYPDPRLVKIYDRTVVPATRLIERFIRPPFGQTVFCVARVPAT